MSIILNNCENVNIENYENAKNGALHIQNLLARYYAENERDNASHGVEQCGTFLKFKAFETGDKILGGANFCKSPLCPMCAWRAHLKQQKILEKAMLSATKYLYHVVLAVPNVEHLTQSYIKRLQRCAGRFLTDPTAICATGYSHNLEITYTPENGFHPHLHCIVETDTFQKVSKPYIREIGLLWRSYFDGSEFPLNKVSYTDDTQNIELPAGYTCYLTGIPKSQIRNASEELSKYVFKSNLNDVNYSVVSALMDCLNNQRKFTSTGDIKKRMRQASDELKNTDRINELALDGINWWWEIYKYINGHYKREIDF